jgi:hypothetical protein
VIGSGGHGAAADAMMLVEVKVEEYDGWRRLGLAAVVGGAMAMCAADVRTHYLPMEFVDGQKTSR